MTLVTGKGHIWREYWIDCSGCDHHQPLSTSAKPSPAARQQGWRQRQSDNKWMCPNCVDHALEIQYLKESAAEAV